MELEQCFFLLCVSKRVHHRCRLPYHLLAFHAINTSAQRFPKLNGKEKEEKYLEKKIRKDNKNFMALHLKMQCANCTPIRDNLHEATVHSVSLSLSLFEIHGDCFAYFCIFCKISL